MDSLLMVFATMNDAITHAQSSCRFD